MPRRRQTRSRRRPTARTLPQRTTASRRIGCFPRGQSFSVAAKAALLIDLNTGRAVYEQDADERVYPASLTKIMTCLLALENGNLSDVVTVSASALDDLDADSSVAGLQVGEQMTLENLLYCMMVVSGNDACNVIAEHIAGSVADFVRMMNQRAYELGCLNTHFSNPHGLHDESHYTTARDLSIITQAALKSENFRQIVDTYEYQLPDDNMRQNIPKLKTTNMLIYRSLSNTLYYPRAHGIKTGYTSQAGRCVISEATGDGLDLLGIVCGAATTVLDSGDLLMENFTECARLFDYGFDNYSYLPIMSPLYPVDQVKINNSAGAEAVAVAPEDEIKVLLPNDYDPDKMVTDIQLNSESVDAPVREGDVLGSVTVSYAGEILGQTKLLAITDVARSEFSSAAAGTGGIYPEKLVEVGRNRDLCRHRRDSGADRAVPAAQAPLPPQAHGAAPPRIGEAAPPLPARATTCRSMSWNNGKGGRFIC